MALQRKSVHIFLRAARQAWDSLKEEIAQTGDPTIMIIQGQAKTYSGDSGTNPSIYAQQDWDDHPGPAPTQEEKVAVEKALRDPEYVVHIHNSFVGNHANGRARGAELLFRHLSAKYKDGGGFQTLVYHMHYDVDGRNDKVHETLYTDANGNTHKISENNAPGGVYAPMMYQDAGVDYISVFDPHSRLHRQNLTNVFGEKNVIFLSNLERISLRIIDKYKDSILDGTFRICAPDGWDKKDDPQKNLATQRIKEVCQIIWDNLQDLHGMYDTVEDFTAFIQIGVTKVRRAAFEGAPAKPEVTGVYGDVKGCKCVAVDDLVDSGDSLIQTGKALLERGAEQFDAAVCHGPAQEAALQNMLTSTYSTGGETKYTISTFMTTNTMARVEGFIEKLPPEQRERIVLINCGEELVKRLKEINIKPIPVLTFSSSRVIRTPTPQVN